MPFNRRSLDTLIDLVEIKLGSMQVIDREDARELKQLEICLRELMVMKSGAGAGGGNARPAN